MPARNEATERIGDCRKTVWTTAEWRATIDEDGHYCFAVAL
jgi:hypothetical protein